MFPVEEKLGEIGAALAAQRDVVLTAPPGSGKTTAVPPALLAAPWLKGKKILMLEPRRLAARNCATYLAKKLGEAVGETVGYQVRLERKVSAATRLEIVTEGLLTQRILSDPELSDVGLVIFDEFHERSLQCDLAFALALEVKNAFRPDLRLLVMSATLDADSVAAHLGATLGSAEVIRAEGRMYPVATKYLPGASIAAGVGYALAETEGDVLCFLPGEGEIRKAQECLANVQCASCSVLPLYGSLPKDEQDKVFARSTKPDARKVILATSIAETSLTLEGVTAVVDTGLMRVPRFSPSTGMSGLVTLPLTSDRAEQRRGRAGRVRAGICYRLWSETSDASRPKKMNPEILDADLASLVLTSAAWGAVRREDLPWMTPPPASAWDQAVGLLKLLGALDASGNLTPKGEKMAKLPMHPRLANMILAGGDPVYAAIIEEGSRTRETDIRYVPITPRIKALAQKFDKYRHSSLNIHTSSLASGASALALAYPDRIAKNRGNGSFRMVSGRGAYLESSDPLASEPYLVCCELDDRPGDAKIFLASPIAEGEIESLFADQIVEEPFCAWDRVTDRVKSVVRRKLGELVLRESVKAKGDEAALIAGALLEGVRLHGVENLPCWTKETRQLKARIEFLNRILGAWCDVSDAAILRVLPAFVGGFNKWKDLEKLDLFQVIDALLAEAGHDRRELERLAPTRMEVPSGSHMLIHYEGDEPTCEVRLQECFGLMETPKVAGGRVPVVMTLLSPAQRPIQITKDLAGFWRGAYALVRKDMRGRYPKHYWPEDPLTAVATRRVRPK